MPPVATVSLEEGPSERLSNRSESRSGVIDLQLGAIILCFIVLICCGVWYIQRIRRQLRSNDTTEFLILGSEITIEIGDDIFEIEYTDTDMDGRPSMETLTTSASPHRMTFDIDKLPIFHIDRKPNNILERRGKKTLRLQPPESGDADMAFVDFKDGKLTVSPFLSRKDGSKVIPVFPLTRKRTPRTSELHNYPLAGIMTAPRKLEHEWRPLDSPELLMDRT